LGSLPIDLLCNACFPLFSTSGGKEFFRVLPKDTPQAQAFEVEGVQVNVISIKLLHFSLQFLVLISIFNFS